MKREMTQELRNEVHGILYPIGDENFQVDDGDDALSEADGGVWVRCWVWVDDEALKCAFCDDGTVTDDPRFPEGRPCNSCAERKALAKDGDRL